MFKPNPMFAIDFYKSSHREMYPEGTSKIYSNFTPRSTTHLNVLKSMYDGKIVFFKLQAFIKSFLIDSFNENFFSQPIEPILKQYKRRMDTSLFTDFDVSHIAALHKLGYLPLLIKALPEGVKVKPGIPVFTVVNTHPDFFWLTNYIETVISAEVWKGMVNATIASHYRGIFEHWANITCSPRDFINWQGHDFSMRGMSGLDDATMNNMGHLLSFFGTDVVPAIDALEYYYGADADNEIVGGSVPATEHSCMCMGGIDDEVGTFRRLITEIYPNGIVSIVSDTWDFWNVLDVTAPLLKEQIMAREGKVVFRPDSGDPVEIICGADIENFDKHEDFTLDECEQWMGEIIVDKVGVETAHGERGESEPEGYFQYKDKFYLLKIQIEWNRYDKQYYYIDGWNIESCEEIEPTPAMLGAVRVLDKHFGHTLTDNGYKVLDSHVGLIYGDSITPQRAYEILRRLKEMGYASCNCVFGIGSYTYNHSTRDSIGAAMKSTSGVVNGERRSIFKDPKTDSGLKKSAKGLLRVELVDDEYVLFDEQTEEQEQQGELKTAFLNGELYNQTTLGEIRGRLIK